MTAEITQPLKLQQLGEDADCQACNSSESDKCGLDKPPRWSVYDLRSSEDNEQDEFAYFQCASWPLYNSLDTAFGNTSLRDELTKEVDGVASPLDCQNECRSYDMVAINYKADSGVYHFSCTCLNQYKFHPLDICPCVNDNCLIDWFPGEVRPSLPVYLLKE